jgi:hypothetical protein
MKENEHYKEAVLENSKWLDNVLMGGFLFSIVVVLLKILGQREVEWMDVKFNLENVWIVFCLFSIAHLYTEILLIRSIRPLWDKCNVEDRNFIYNKIVATGGIYVRGLVARTKVLQDWELKVDYRMSFKDPSAWVAYISFLILLGAIIPFPLFYEKIHQVVIALLFSNINWIIGTNWVVALSELSNSFEESLDASERGSMRSMYFEEFDKNGICVVTMSSGGDAMRSIPYYIAPLWMLFGIAIRFFLAPFFLLFLFLLSLRWLWKLLKRLFS